jgi:hypothetical protein
VLTFISLVLGGLKWTRIILKLNKGAVVPADLLQQKPHMEVIPT